MLVFLGLFLYFFFSHITAASPTAASTFQLDLLSSLCDIAQAPQAGLVNRIIMSMPTLTFSWPTFACGVCAPHIAHLELHEHHDVGYHGGFDCGLYWPAQEHGRLQPELQQSREHRKLHHHHPGPLLVILHAKHTIVIYYIHNIKLYSYVLIFTQYNHDNSGD